MAHIADRSEDVTSWHRMQSNKEQKYNHFYITQKNKQTGCLEDLFLFCFSVSKIWSQFLSCIIIKRKLSCERIGLFNISKVGILAEEVYMKLSSDMTQCRSIE